MSPSGSHLKGGGHVPSEKVKIAYYPLFMSLGIKLFSILLEYVFAYDVRDLILLTRVLQLEIDTNTYEVSSSKMLKINTPWTTMDCSSTKQVSFERDVTLQIEFQSQTQTRLTIYF